MPYLCKYFPRTTRGYYLKRFKQETVARHAWKIFGILYVRVIEKS